MNKPTHLLACAATLIIVAAAQPAAAKSRSDTRVVIDTDARLFYGDRKGSGDFEDSGRSGYRFGARLGVDHESGGNEFSLDIGSAIIEYFDKDQRDRWSNSIGVGYGRELGGDLKLTTGASYTTQVLGLEHDKFNQAQVRGGLEYEPGDDRFRFGGGYRWRDYDDAGNTNGQGYFIDTDYRHKLGARQAISLDVVFDRINADVASRDYKRISVTPAYGFPISKGLDANISLRWRSWTYDNRIIDGSKRRDHSIQPMARLTYEIAKDWDLYAEAGWRRRWSKDPSGDENGPRGAIGISYRLRVND